MATRWIVSYMQKNTEAQPKYVSKLNPQTTEAK